MSTFSTSAVLSSYLVVCILAFGHIVEYDGCAAVTGGFPQQTRVCMCDCVCVVVHLYVHVSIACLLLCVACLPAGRTWQLDVVVIRYILLIRVHAMMRLGWPGRPICSPGRKYVVQRSNWQRLRLRGVLVWRRPRNCVLWQIIFTNVSWCLTDSVDIYCMFFDKL